MTTPPPISPAFVNFMAGPVTVGDDDGLPGVVLIREDTEADCRVSLANLAAILDVAVGELEGGGPDQDALAQVVRELRSALGLGEPE